MRVAARLFPQGPMSVFSLLCVCVSKGNTVKVSPSSRTRSLLRRDDRDGIAQTVERATNRKESRETPQLGGQAAIQSCLKRNEVKDIIAPRNGQGRGGDRTFLRCRHV